MVRIMDKEGEKQKEKEKKKVKAQGTERERFISDVGLCIEMLGS